MYVESFLRNYRVHEIVEFPTSFCGDFGDSLVEICRLNRSDAPNFPDGCPCHGHKNIAVAKSKLLQAFDLLLSDSLAGIKIYVGRLDFSYFDYRVTGLCKVPSLKGKTADDVRDR